MNDVILMVVGLIVALFCMNLADRYGKIVALVVWFFLVLVSAFVFTVLTKGWPQ